jgi:tetratricopeptide (TPR) repeat protein
LSRQARDKWGVGNVVTGVGDVWYLEGDYGQARACYKEGLQICREMGNKWGLASSFTHLAYAALRQGRSKEAHAHLVEALAMCREFAYAYNSGTAACLVGWAGLTAAQGQPERAARLLGAAKAILGHVDRRLTFLCPIEYERIASAVRSQLDEATLAAVWTRGRAMAAATADESWERAIAYASEMAHEKPSRHGRLRQ